MFTLLPALCGLLILYLENFRPLEALRGTFLEKLICGVSTVGYGIYLTHMLIFERLSRFFVDAGFAMNWLGFLLAIAAAIACGALLYIVVEVPANKLRDKVLAAQAENPHQLSV